MVKNKGLVHIYFGDGKGKTTAALGLAMRAIGCGKKVCFIQFLKPRSLTCSEHKFIQKFCPQLEVVRFSVQHPIFSGNEKINAKVAALKNLERVERLIKQKRFDMVILDEILNLKPLGWISDTRISKIIKAKPKNAELVLTGRCKLGRLKKLADYVTEFRCVKHPFSCGVLARKGIEF